MAATRRRRLSTKRVRGRASINVGKIDTLEVRKQVLRITKKSLRDLAPMSDATREAKGFAVANVKVDSGQLKDSIQEKIIFRKGSLVGVVTAKAKHAPFVELGTSRMGAQPFMRPALKGPSRRLVVERYRSSLARRVRTY